MSHPTHEQRFFLVILLALCFVFSQLGVVKAQSHGPYESLDDVWQGQLRGAAALMPSRETALKGGQKFGQCCYLAVSQSLEIKNGSLAYREGQTMFRGNVSSLERFQMPCDAVYNGSTADQPQVWVSYNWCSSNCPGWGVAHSTDLGDWVQPMVAFILPSVVFVLNIPRRRRINVPKTLFPQLTGASLEKISLLLKIPAASLLIILDTIIWLCTVWATAGPLLLSGIYEALLDLRLLRFLESRYSSNSLSVKERSHLLLIILLGNLDLNPAWEHSKLLVIRLPNESLSRRCGSCHQPLFPATTDTSIVGRYPDSTLGEIAVVKLKLKSMLESQYSFGSSVGAAVLFYTGSFIYTLWEIKSNWGDGRSAHHLAFGIFWTIIPHIAIVSSLLLGGNNPSAWEGIVAQPNHNAGRTFSEIDTIRLNDSVCGLPTGVDGAITPVLAKQRTDEQTGSKVSEVLCKLYQPVYKTCYKPAWMWNRGMSKAAWVTKFLEENPQLEGLRFEVLQMGVTSWFVYTLAPAYILMLIPPFLGGMISYTTPMIGLSCRSMTTLIWASSQTLLMILWMVDWKFWGRDKFLQGSLKSATTVKASLSWAEMVWCLCFVLGIMGAVITSIGGTMFVLMQLYRNCLCWISIQYWLHRHSDPGAQMYLSDGSTEQIYYAKKFWMPTGITAMVLLISLTYLGWWYQRRLRAQFHSLVRRIDG